MRLIGLGLIVALLVGGCQDDPAPVTVDPSPTSAPATGCFEPSLPTIKVLARGITVDGATLAVAAITAEKTDGLWYLAGELEGPKFEGDGDVAVWATTDDPTGEAVDFAAVSALAIEESEWEPEADISGNDPVLDELRACVQQLLDDRAKRLGGSEGED